MASTACFWGALEEEGLIAASPSLEMQLEALAKANTGTA